MKSHLQIVAALHIALGVLSLLAAVGIFCFIAMFGGLAVLQGEGQLGVAAGVIAVALGGFLALLALPGIIGGWALLANKSWARPLILILAALHVLNFPIGTAIGVYSFWALLAGAHDTSPE